MAVGPPSMDKLDAMNRETYDYERYQKERMKQAEDAAETAIDSSKDKAEKVKNEYEKQSMSDMARQEEAYETERARGQEVIENLRVSLSSEARRLHREGEKNIRNTTEHYEDEINKLERDSKQKRKEVLVQNEAMNDYEMKTGRSAADAAKQTYGNQLRNMSRAHEKNVGRMQDGQNAHLGELKEKTRMANEQAQKTFEGQHAALVNQHQTELADLEHTSTQRLRDIQLATADRLGTYSDKKVDPFYRLVNMDASIYDMGDAYVLKAQIPDHEQDHVSVSVTNGQITLSGRRRNQDTLNLGPGRNVSTASYQSFSETFPISESVEAKELRKEFNGDELSITIPKTKMKGYMAYKAK